MEKKIAGAYFKDDSDRIGSVITVTLEDGELSISDKDGAVMICVDPADLRRVLVEMEV